MDLSITNILILLILTGIIFLLISVIFRIVSRIIYYRKYGKPNTGMYYDPELGSINGEVDNRGKYVCDCCDKRFKTKRELILHLRIKKVKKIWHT